MKTYDERRKSVNEYVSKIKAKRRKTAIMATGICLAVAILSAVLFVPYSTTPPDVSMYKDSEYYAVIQQLNLATYQKPKYKNNFQMLTARLGSLSLKTEMAPGDIGGFDGTESGGASNANNSAVNNATSDEKYVEVTDNQVEGVIESDRMKRSDKYIYYLRGFELSVYSIAGDDSTLVGSYTIRKKSDDIYNYEFYPSVSMFLSADGKTVTVILQGQSNTYGRCLTLMNLDVSDPTKIRIKNEVYFTGSYGSVRMVDGDILMIYSHSAVWCGNPLDFSRPETFVPKTGNLYSMTPLPAENILCPEDANSTHYTVVCKVDAASLEIEGCIALMGYSGENVYVSQDTVYTVRSYIHSAEPTFSGKYKRTNMAEITGVSYAGEGLEILGTVTLEGSVKDQYSMDQYDGILRVVTSTAVTGFWETFFGEYQSVTMNVTERNVNLYCVNLSDWQVEASVIGFAPAGEEATSVRFDGKNAYVCTAEVITFRDPVYFFDLSDLSNITYTDTGIIDGYSTSLIQLGDGYLMGIGYGENRRLKIEIYEKAENSVEPVCTYEPGALFSEVYKSYFIDREKNLVGLAIKEWDSEEGKYVSQYVLLHFDGYQLNVVKTMDCEGNLGSVRAALIDGYFYVFSDLFRVESLT